MKFTRFEQLEKTIENFHIIDFDSIDIDEFNYTVKREHLRLRFDRNFEHNLSEYQNFYRGIYSSKQEHIKSIRCYGAS